jgi:hypothetical protein
MITYFKNEIKLKMIPRERNFYNPLSLRYFECHFLLNSSGSLFDERLVMTVVRKTFKISQLVPQIV